MGSIFDYILKIISNRPLRKRIIFTILLLGVYQIIKDIPLSVIDQSQLAEFFKSNQLFGLLDLFSGGALSNFSIGFMGVAPYITASIIMQLLVYVVPALENLQKEGQQGQEIINQYTRLMTIPLGFIQSFGLITLLKSQGVISSLSGTDLLYTIIITTASAVFLMWIGEIITEQGIGNGISLIITAGIVSSIPGQVINVGKVIFTGETVDSATLIRSLIFIAITLITVAFIVLINDSVRRIPVSYARRVVGRKSLRGVDSYLPIKINAAGVIPIIFALSIIVFPGIIANFIAQNARSQVLVKIAESVKNGLDPNSMTYGIVYFVLVIAFTYFYTSIVFKPKDIAENLQKQGGFIPGIRPGNETASFLARITNRLTLPGSIFLGIIAILPFILQQIFKSSTFIIGGTGILIIVSVVLETANQAKAHMYSHTYYET